MYHLMTFLAYIFSYVNAMSPDKFHADNRTAETPRNMCKLEKMQCSKERKFKKKKMVKKETISLL